MLKVRVAEVGSLSARAKMATQILVWRVFAILWTNASFLQVIANLQVQFRISCNIYHVYNRSFFGQETLFLAQKSTFLPKVFQKVRKL